MSETKYTPGPWHAKYDPNGYIDAIDVQDGRGINIAWCSTPFGKTDEVKANAKLIASAPLLLAALKNLLDTIGTDEQYDWDAAIAQCKSAILQAEGDAPPNDHPAKEGIHVSDDHYSVLASRILEEHKKYSGRFLLPDTWAQVAARKVVSQLREMGYMDSAPKEKQAPPVLTDDEIVRIAANLYVMPGYPWSDEVRDKQLVKRSYAAEALRYARDHYGFGSGLTVDKVMEVVEEFIEEEVGGSPEDSRWNWSTSHEKWKGLIADLRTRIEQAANNIDQ